MRDIFGTSSVIEEARLSARKNAKEGRRPGQSWWVSTAVSLAIFGISQMLMSIPLSLYVIKDLFDLDLENGGTIDFSFEMDWKMVLIMLWTEIIMIVLFIIYTKKFEKRKISSIGFRSKGAVLYYITGLIGGIAAFSGAVMICKALGVLSLEFHKDLNLSVMLLFVGGWIIQGLAEEVMCRGFLITSIARRYSVTTAVLISSILFSVLHLGNAVFSKMSLLSLINLFLFGLFASLLFIRTENILFVGAFHSAWNLVQGNVYGIPVSGVKNVPTIWTVIAENGKDLIHGGDFGLEGGLVVTGILLVGCLILLFIRKKNGRAYSLLQK